MSKVNDKQEEKTLEEAFGELNGMIEQLEDSQVSLENSFQIYQEGMKLLKYCNDKIDTVEKKMLVINEDGGLDEF
ncbi:exodeoxyribonuclease VII small subunit [Diplocloster agilis]|uniref:Exodeoxyribonuclease 7 small subunit n=1 Tax=Diplocloster agilis TaxID=2850323 RepID=A0A949K8Z1_9FIRM|nr:MULTISPECIES: exodeoxyribonuclease VII small subunit [Lachnospiraceae]MBU9738952.1 exodeoxyribonuclease VII small subunit [Diplocloster agilis]MBU9743761.1 exodeoxyribonuclease VII small subunit [Diplocloster agilis]MCU6733969.1 exodeoxyribonuclease VII small subunit [Suonthocola fibrivorans]SCJ17904.1 exodeoxyribonuclease VII small subunit [uncultured Clostridium sp.]